MVRRTTVAFLPFLLCLLLTLPGCIAFYSYREVWVEARDGRTDHPYGNTLVEAIYPTMGVINPPESDNGISTTDGRVLLRLATYPGLLRIHAVENLEQPKYPGIWFERAHVIDGGVLEPHFWDPERQEFWTVHIVFEPQ